MSYQLYPTILTNRTEIQHFAGIDFIDLILSVILAVKNRVHIEKFGAVELEVAEDGDEHEEDDDFELVFA